MKVALACLLLAMPVAEAIDFTPVEVKIEGEGGVYSYLRFSDQGKPVTYNPPRHWAYQGRGEEFRLIPPNGIEAEVEIVALATEKALVAGEETLKVFEDMAVDSLPKGATKIERTSVTWNPFQIDGRQTVEVSHSYVLFGRTMSICRLYLPTEKKLFRFSVVAKADDIVDLRRAFHSSLHTFAGL